MDRPVAPKMIMALCAPQSPRSDFLMICELLRTGIILGWSQVQQILVNLHVFLFISSPAERSVKIIGKTCQVYFISCAEDSFKKVRLCCVTHTGTFLCFFAFFSFSLWDWKGNITVKDKKDCDIPSDSLFISLFFFCAFVDMVVQLDLCRSSVTSVTIQNRSVAPACGEVWYFPIWNYYVFWKKKKKCWLLKGKKVQKPRWLDAAAGSKLVTKKYGRLVYVCFIKHLFLVLFLAALAAGCQQGSWFWSSV